MLAKKYSVPMTTEERIKGGASALPVIGDAISGYDAYQSAKKGDYLGAALNAIGLLPMIPALAGSIKYVRRTPIPSSPFNVDVPYAMFLEADKGARHGLDLLSKYGESKWIATDKGATNVSELQKNILKEIRRQGIHNEYGTTAAQLAREANPANILDSAGIWDNPSIISAIYDGVFGKKEINSVKTNNGLIKFSADGIRKVGK